MIRCDLCEKEVESHTLQTVRKPWQADGMRDICRECRLEVDKTMQKVDQLVERIKDTRKREAVFNVFQRIRRKHGKDPLHR